MGLRVVGESLVRLGELQVVHLQVTQVDRRRGGSQVSGQQQGQRGNDGLNHVETITTLDTLAAAALLVPHITDVIPGRRVSPARRSGGSRRAGLFRDLT